MRIRLRKAIRVPRDTSGSVAIDPEGKRVLSASVAQLFMAGVIPGLMLAFLLGADTVVIGHDMRPSSPGMAQAFAEGASLAGAAVIKVGLASTDQLYFASGHLGHAGVMFTPSHNPAAYNGMKMCRAGAVPIGITVISHGSSRSSL